MKNNKIDFLSLEIIKEIDMEREITNKNNNQYVNNISKTNHNNIPKIQRKTEIVSNFYDLKNILIFQNNYPKNKKTETNKVQISIKTTFQIHLLTRQSLHKIITSVILRN